MYFDTVQQKKYKKQITKQIKPTQNKKRLLQHLVVFKKTSKFYQNKQISHPTTHSQQYYNYINCKNKYLKINKNKKQKK